MHESEHDVVHRLALRDGDRDREERDAPLGVERAVDRIDDDERPHLAAEPPDLLGDHGARDLAHAGENHVLGRLVDRRRLVAAEPRPDDRFALGSRRQPDEHVVDVRDRCPAELQPVSQAEGAAGRR